MVTQTVSKAFTKVFGSRNERLLKAYRRRVEQVSSFESEVRGLSDGELRAKTAEFRQRFEQGEPRAELQPEVMAVAREVMDRAVGIRNTLDPAQSFDPQRLPESMREVHARLVQRASELEPEAVPGGEPAPGWMQVEVPVEYYQAVRELVPLSRPPFRARPFDVQIIGGLVLSEGRIAEMKTGEGKTIVAPLACYQACIEGLCCHVVTVNDYLVQRDRDWVFPFYYWLGLTVGAIHPQHMQPPQKKAEAYGCDVLYATNSELGFDYLRDNMKLSVAEQVQTRRDFCIIDEVDSILIDEARTPLIISGPAHEEAPRYGLADQIAKSLIEKQKAWDAADAEVQKTLHRVKALEGDIRNARDKSKVPAMKAEMKQLEQKLPELEAHRDQYAQYYEVEMDRKSAHLTDLGVAEAQKEAGIGSFYVGANMDFPHLLENALRARAVYQRDKDYVVQNGEVIIVDEFTGRLMIGRQWSNGLHQAVEAKEGVKIKQETQTLATVTIQNFFKLYKRLAGMTGTAITEATEFYEIYRMDVVSIPTNRAIARVDRDDLIFLSAKDKWETILDEIKRVHDLGRPVLVGTTSVEKSEMLSHMLRRKHNVPHEVLNAKQHEREAGVVQNAGQLGAVMIATNMAGRGTDIKLQPVTREALVRHWQQRDLLPRQADASMDDDQLIALAYRHQAQQQLGLKKKELDGLSDGEVRLRLLRHWVQHDAWVPEKKAQAMTREQCEATLDTLPDYQQHRLAIWDHVEAMGGLHIVGTERHESRRIDNQLRGRSGRQGDKGSSRFFISLEDDLMKLFAGKTTLTALSKLGMKEGDAIEHRWVTRSVERAQKKVEERNYQIRKNLLEYDEVMEHQRNDFYGVRQDTLEGKRVQQLIFDYIEQAVEDAVGLYKDKEYTQTQVAEWIRQQRDVSIEPARLHLDDLDELRATVRRAAHTDIQQIVDLTLGEYMSDDTPPSEWDLAGLTQWAMSRFSVDLKANKLREMNVQQVRDQLIDAAREQLDRKELEGLEKFAVPHYAERQLAEWARNKFGIELDVEQLAAMEPEQAVDHVLGEAREAYRKREITYPVEFILDVVFQGAQQDQQWAIGQLLTWVRQRYELEWTPERVTEIGSAQELFKVLSEEAEAWLRDGGKLERQVAEKVGELGGDPEKVAAWLGERFAITVEPSELADADDLEAEARRRGREALRAELTQLERFVLLQILDQAWKDHLYSMDQAKDSVGLRGYAERDPRIEYKREGANLYAQMQRRVRDRVTDLIFRARLTPNVQLHNVYGAQQQAQHADPARVAAASASQGTAQQQQDLASADAAAQGDGDGDRRPMTRKQRRAAEARERRGKRSKR